MQANAMQASAMTERRPSTLRIISTLLRNLSWQRWKVMGSGGRRRRSASGSVITNVLGMAIAIVSLLIMWACSFLLSEAALASYAVATRSLSIDGRTYVDQATYMEAGYLRRRPFKSDDGGRDMRRHLAQLESSMESLYGGHASTLMSEYRHRGDVFWTDGGGKGFTRFRWRSVAGQSLAPGAAALISAIALGLFGLMVGAHRIAAFSLAHERRLLAMMPLSLRTLRLIFLVATLLVSPFVWLGIFPLMTAAVWLGGAGWAQSLAVGFACTAVLGVIFVCLAEVVLWLGQGRRFVSYGFGIAGGLILVSIGAVCLGALPLDLARANDLGALSLLSPAAGPLLDQLGSSIGPLSAGVVALWLVVLGVSAHLALSRGDAAGPT
jgi:hypothetical protein